MRRYLQVFGIILLLLTTMLPAAAVAQAADTFSLAASAGSVKSGEDVVITVKGESLTDVYGAELEISYDTAKLQYTGYSSSLRGQAFIREPEVSGGRILLVYTYTGSRVGPGGNQDLFSLTFKAAEAGSASVKVNSVIALNRLGQSLTGTLGGEIQVSVLSANPTTPIKTPTSSPTSSPGASPTPSPAKDPGASSAPNIGPTSSFNPGQVTLEAVISSQGIASVNIRKEDLLAAAEIAKDGALILQVSAIPEANEIHFQLPAKAWIQITSAANGSGTLQLQMGWATVNINVNLLKSLPVSESSSLEFIIEKADSAELPLEIRKRITDSSVYNFALLLDGVQLTNFNGNIKVGLPYVPYTDEIYAQVIINHITDNGTIEVVKNGRYNASTGRVEFKPNHFSKYTANYASVSFRDIDGYSWANEAVLGLAAREVIQGRNTGHFVPGGEVTRAEFVQMLINLFELGNTSASTAFTDVKPDAWYSQSIAAAQQVGLIQGKKDGSFGVNDRISREDMAVLIYRASKLLNVTTAGETNGEITTFLDQAQTSSYAIEAVNIVQQSNLMNGLTQGYFGPKESSTRVQAAAVLFRLYQTTE